MLKSYEELIAWQKAMSFTEEVYRLSKLLPQGERYALSDQLRRSAISVPSNIAEGFGRDSTKDFLHFLMIARGSLNEARTQLTLASRLGFLDDIKSSLQLAADTSRLINSLAAKLRSKLS